MIIERPEASDFAYLRVLWKEAFGDTDEFLDIFRAAAFSADRCRWIRDGNEAAAALYWFDCSVRGRKIAYIYAVATAEKHRGKGLCRALMDAAHRALASDGYSGAVLVPSGGALFGFYGKMGYQTCSYIRSFSCAAGGGISVPERIGRDEYAVLRRRLLPPGGVIQEGENLDFLITQAELYKCGGSVLAARREGDVLVCPEILGGTDCAPMITKSLGCSAGRFRTPADQDGEKFAMYLPFDDCAPPEYFGLAFD